MHVVMLVIATDVPNWTSSASPKIQRLIQLRFYVSPDTWETFFPANVLAK